MTLLLIFTDSLKLDHNRPTLHLVYLFPLTKKFWCITVVKIFPLRSNLDQGHGCPVVCKQIKL